jgi:hypothetical protein
MEFPSTMAVLLTPGNSVGLNLHVPPKGVTAAPAAAHLQLGAVSRLMHDECSGWSHWPLAPGSGKADTDIPRSSLTAPPIKQAIRVTEH